MKRRIGRKMLAVVCACVLWCGVDLGLCEARTIQIKDRDMLYAQLAEAMRRHEDCIAFDYPNMDAEWIREREREYRGLLDALALEDGYALGNVRTLTIRSGNGAVAFEMEYQTTRSQERYISRCVRRMTGAYRALPVLRRIRRAHDDLIRLASYDVNADTAYDVFADGKGNCMAYALTFQRIMQELEVPCICVMGSDHAWNMVAYRGKWYQVDVTWDDTERTTAYFMKGTKDFPEHEHVRNVWISERKLARRSVFR